MYQIDYIITGAITRSIRQLSCSVEPFEIILTSMASNHPGSKRSFTDKSQTGAARKKARIQHARKIETEQIEQQKLEHSKLPQFLGVEKFISSRAFEISAMEQAMKAARQASGQRAFQTLPRHLRRRAASHFARRVPTRLRSKALFEMKNDKKKIPSRSVKCKLKRKAFKDQGRTDKLKKRQARKKWLMTHLWHAKRTKMIDIWGFRLAKTPTEKCFRSTYRASRHGATLHDLSYYSHLSLTGPEADIVSILKRLCDPLGVDPCSVRYQFGHRVAEVTLYTDLGWPHSPIGPASILWRPVDNDVAILPPHDKMQLDSVPCNDLHPSTSNIAHRTLLIQVHPSMKSPLMEAIQRSSDSKIAIDDRNDLGCLEIGGIRSTEVLGRVLTSPEHEGKTEVANWLDNGLRANVFPMGMILGLTVDDPRLRFPPPKMTFKEKQALDVPIIQPSTRYAQCARFWSSGERDKRVKFRKVELDKRRAQLPLPGTRLVRTEEDDQISVLLFRCDIGWRLILPMRWTQAFFHSFVFTSPRLVCLDQRAQISFETGKPSFPKDFPTLAPSNELAKQTGLAESEFWERHPPAKRVNYSLMDTRGGGGGDPFVTDWAVLFTKSKNKPEQSSNKANLILNEKEPPVDSICAPWLMMGPLVGLIAENIVKLCLSSGGYEIRQLEQFAPRLIDGIVDKVKRSMAHNGQACQQSSEHRSIQHALVRVKIIPSGGHGKAGVLNDLARMYWSGSLVKDGLDVGTTGQQRDLIGFVTTGQYCLTKASSVGFGAISLITLIKMIINNTFDSMKLDSTDLEKNVMKMEFLISYRNKYEIDHEIAKLMVIP